MPGVGKTQLALQYAALASGRSQDTYTFWVPAGSVEKLAQDFSRLVNLLRLPGRHGSDQFTKLARRAVSRKEVASRSGQHDLSDCQDDT